MPSIPLLRDHHTHPLLYAAFMDGLDLGRHPDDSREMAVERIRAQVGGEGWSIAYGWNSAQYELSAADFDDLGPLAVLNLSLHGLVVNAAGLLLLRRIDPGIADNLSDQAWIERNLRHVLNALAGEGATAGRLRRFFDRLLHDHGIYEAEELLLTGPEEIELFDAAGLADRTAFWAPPGLYERLPDGLRERVHGIKLFTDGAIGAWTAALGEPYRGTADRGMLLYSDDELAAAVRPHIEAGRPLAIHAIGDRAVDQVVHVFERVGAAGTEIRIEHAQFISPDAARRARRLGARLCMQPNFSDDSRHYADRVPPGYPERNNPFRMLIDEAGFVPGVDLVFGSDGMPHGVSEAVRQALFPWFEAQRLSIDELAAGYCLPTGTGPGEIELEIDWDGRSVFHRVALERVHNE